jgi:hypothetical protein
MSRYLRRIAPALLALGLLTACGTTSDDTAPAPHATRPAVAITNDTTDDTPTADSTTDETALIIDLAWAGRSDTDKRNMCAGIALFGTEWAADKMRDGAGGDDSIDWDRAAVLVQAKCDDL